MVFHESLLLSKLISLLTKNRQIYIKFSNAFWCMQAVVAKGVATDYNHILFMKVQLLYNPMQQQWYLSIPLNVIFDII